MGLLINEGLLVNEIDVPGMKGFNLFASQSLENPNEAKTALADWFSQECDITPEQAMENIKALGRIRGALANQDVNVIIIS